jgi:replicative DNA helicase
MANENKLRGKELLDRERELSTYEGRDRIVSSREMAEELAKTEESVFKILTGVKSLDRILGDGVEAGELITVTGPTGEGKTTLLMSITKNMAEAGTNSVWFTLEVTPRQFMQKLIKAQGGEDPRVPLFYLPRAGLEDAEDDYVRDWEKKRRRRYEMVDWIEDKVIEAKVKIEKDGQLLKVVYIDHIHQIFPMAKMQNVSLEIGDLVARIKGIAITHNLAIFLIAHTKDDPQGTAREPRKQDIRDSGLITRLSDTIIGVWRIRNSNDGTKQRLEEIGEEDNKAKVRVFKNRRAGTLGFFTMYHKNHYLTEDFDFDEAMSSGSSEPDDEKDPDIPF